VSKLIARADHEAPKTVFGLQVPVLSPAFPLSLSCRGGQERRFLDGEGNVQLTVSGQSAEIVSNLARVVLIDPIHKKFVRDRKHSLVMAFRHERQWPNPRVKTLFVDRRFQITTVNLPRLFNGHFASPTGY
jgi:hypothetical protein